jgi:hypothetical protein
MLVLSAYPFLLLRETNGNRTVNLRRLAHPNRLKRAGAPP